MSVVILVAETCPIAWSLHCRALTNMSHLPTLLGTLESMGRGDGQSPTASTQQAVKDRVRDIIALGSWGP